MFKVKNKNLIYTAAGITFLLILSLSVPVLRNPFLSVLRNPLIALDAVRREINGFIFYHRNYVQNDKLRREADFLRERLSLAQDIDSENIRLKKLLSFKQESPFKVIAARVIGRAADSWSSSVILDKGKNSGIRRGMAVITYLGLVGRVVEVQGSTSKVLLLNDPNIAVSAMVKRSRQEGLVCGTLGSMLIMRYLPKDSDIRVSDEVITSGLTDAYPKGISIGTVVDINDEFSGLSRYAMIKPLVNLPSVEEVLIVIQ